MSKYYEMSEIQRRKTTWCDSNLDASMTCPKCGSKDWELHERSGGYPDYVDMWCTECDHVCDQSQIIGI
jgi:DNA-directed RNA polymerase subunit M/transcription elongation factor TFIIS